MNKERELFENSKTRCLFYDLNNKTLQEWKQSQMNKSKTHIMAYMEIFSSRVKDLLSKERKHDFVTKDSAGRRIYAWRIELKNGTLWVLSGKSGRGTSYEYVSKNPEEFTKEFIRFLEDKIIYNLKEIKHFG